jgi:hypothetical protein
MATVTDERPHLILVTRDTCVESQTVLNLWNQLLVDPHMASKYQFKHVARDNDNREVVIGTPLVYYDIIRWFPWLMVISNYAWTRLEKKPRLLLMSKLFNGRFSTDESGNNDIIRTPQYPNTYIGILTWLRHCYDTDPTAFPYVRIEPPPPYHQDIPTVAPRLSLSPFWAAAYRDRSLPFAPDTRKVIGSSYLPELEKRRHALTAPSIELEQLAEYQQVMKPILLELQLLGLIDAFNLDQPPTYYVQLIQRHLDLLIRVHLI